MNPITATTTALRRRRQQREPRATAVPLPTLLLAEVRDMLSALWRLLRRSDS